MPFMREFNYHRQKYATIKSVLSVIFNALTLSWIILEAPDIIANSFTTEIDQRIVLISIFVLYALLSLCFVLVPFGSVIEPINSKEFVTYKRLAFLKWNTERWPRPTQEEIKIVQEPDRYFKIVIQIDKDKIVALDKFATLDNATKYLDDLKSVMC